MFACALHRLEEEREWVLAHVKWRRGKEENLPEYLRLMQQEKSEVSFTVCRSIPNLYLIFKCDFQNLKVEYSDFASAPNAILQERAVKGLQTGL